MGDVDDDGYDDVVVGALYNAEGGTYAGAAYLVIGSAFPASSRLSAAVKYTGEAASDFAGSSVSGAGDVNGDGFDDILVGAANSDDGSTDAGAAYLVLGGAFPASAILSAAVEYQGDAYGDFAGASVSGTGDVDGDGYDDIVVGASYDDDGGFNAGAAYLVLGSASPVSASLSTAIQYWGPTEQGSAGASVSGAGDVDGDGHDDIVVGASHLGTGVAYLVLGAVSPSSASLSTAVLFQGEAEGDDAGWSVSEAGDVDGDGYGDILVGAFQNDDGGVDAGAAYLVAGSAFPVSTNLSTAVEYQGLAAADRVGYSVSGAGDVDGDGHDDILIGAPWNGDGEYRAGAAYLVLGSSSPAPGSLSTAAEFVGESLGDEAGGSVSGAGDVDGNGFDDILVGAENNGTLAGAAYILLGHAE